MKTQCTAQAIVYIMIVVVVQELEGDILELGSYVMPFFCFSGWPSAIIFCCFLSNSKNHKKVCELRVTECMREYTNKAPAQKKNTECDESCFLQK